ncbi:hypothetical protein [Acidihalobacter ferrooxydans]|uniref:Lipoprotein SmpA/OmlA domain-containing protein n=1 Tax=Acidihalobacter ferrooxydans TaxID=1765967 RepID=A0A1P8UE33_9GAMM|nr:hypothetical protein [Acidihalobacter ferrooxydans]APZ42049.1 hypothetical protein BW247_02175 [Acidihalobacter ferrooxydans]
MKFFTFIIGLLAAVWLGSASAALSAGAEYNIQLLRSGNPVQIRSAAENIYHQRGAAPAVLDTLAGIILQHKHEQGRTYVDALSWGCKALGISGQKRYYTLMKNIADNGQLNGKLRKYCGRGASDLGGPAGEQYPNGAITPAQSAQNPRTAQTPVPRGNYKPISVVKPGMSMQEVEALCGPPTSSHSYQTGKAWIPFHFKGNDDYRTQFKYKGQGSVTFSNTSAYTSGMRVKEVHLNPNASGY